MNIVHLSTSDIGHGAGMAAYRLHQALRQAGLDSRMIVGQKLSDDPNVYGSRPLPQNRGGRILRQIDHLLEGVLNLGGPQNFYSVLAKGLWRHPLVQQADVIHLHGINETFKNLSLRLLLLSKTKKLFWTFHDMWPLTGHCFYSYECPRWKTGCGHCPHLDVFPRLLYDTSAFQWKIKRKLYQATRPSIICPSSWMADMARQSPLLNGCVIHHIPYAIDTAVFRPMDRTECRRLLGLPADAHMILFVSLTNNTRKGLPVLKTILAKLQTTTNIILLTVGQNLTIGEPGLNFSHRNLGMILDPAQMAKIYCAADIHALPSRQDNLPNAVLESLACGTPVAAFNVGGVADLVEHQKNGYLAESGNAEDFANGLRWLLGPKNLQQSAQSIHDSITNNFSYAKIAQRHSDLYRHPKRGNQHP